MNDYYWALIAFVVGLLVGIIVVTVGRNRRNRDKYTKIDRIDRMREKGQLSQEEFELEKKKILQGS